jgi:Asp-tRNA(Asn)/Glu-tRNA(Gln) amidotransferase A subunit family amidase
MLSALDLARRIEAGTLSPAAVMDICAQAIAEREAEIGAFVQLDLDRAHAHARDGARALAALPLRGLPVGVKDIFDTSDFATGYGATFYAGHRPVCDAAAVAMLRRAGGLVVGKTVTTELAHAFPGRTRNPHHREHTPGGSSSGSAAAVAAGMLPLAFGTQTAGSVIRPAAFCGVAGYKPSFRMIPMVGVKCFAWSLDTAGLFGAAVADVAFAAAALTGRDLRVDADAPVSPRIGIARTHIWDQASADMQRAVEHAARAAQAAGADLREVTLPDILERAWEAQAVVQDYEAARALAFEYDHYRDRIAPTLRTLLENGNGIPAERYDAARRITRHARHALADLFVDYDALLTPSAPGAAPHGLGSTGLPIFNRLWTLMGVPCVNVPGLTDAGGLPLGVQVVGRFGRDRTTLAAAAFIQAAIGTTRN